MTLLDGERADVVLGEAGGDVLRRRRWQLQSAGGV
jgi:hypothetical protein